MTQKYNIENCLYVLHETANLTDWITWPLLSVRHPNIQHHLITIDMLQGLPLTTTTPIHSLTTINQPDNSSHYLLLFSKPAVYYCFVMSRPQMSLHVELSLVCFLTRLLQMPLKDSIFSLAYSTQQCLWLLATWELHKFVLCCSVWCCIGKSVTSA